MTKTTHTDTDKAADVKPATAFEQSGAPVQAADIDTGHPAVDANPRAGTTEAQNRIDFNDPTLTGAEAVAKNLANQGEA